MALDLFDRLRLREPLAQSFSALGFEGEEGWRVAARIKVVLLSEAGIGKGEPSAADEAQAAESTPAAEFGSEPALYQGTASAVPQETTNETGASAPVEPNAPSTSASAAEFDSGPALYQGTASAVPQQTPNEPEASAPADAPSFERVALPAALWLDPDVRWLTGVHQAEGHAYLVRERYEELLWWLLMPSLLRLAGQPALDRSAIRGIGEIVKEALDTAEAAGYRVDTLLSPPAPFEEPTSVEPSGDETEPA
jgi:hypothetical protein